MDDNKLLSVQNLFFAYGSKKILKNINLHLNNNEIISVLGSSGVGKTTLFHLISGVLPLQEGQIKVRGQVEYRGQISYMLQKDMLFEHKTVLNNVILPLLIKGEKKEQAQVEGLKLLEEFSLQEWANHYPVQLSGGMRQRVALLRTALFKRPIVLLDEAFSALDAITKRSLHKWYLNLKDKLGLSTILITHDIDEALFLSDRIYLLKNTPGEVVCEISISPEEQQDTQLLFAKKKQILDILGLD